MNTDGDAALNKNEFAKFFKTISTRKEIVNLMTKFSTKGATMTVEDFQSFLVREQGVSGNTMLWLVRQLSIVNCSSSYSEKEQIGLLICSWGVCKNYGIQHG